MMMNLKRPNQDFSHEIMTDLLWCCPKCGGSDDRLEAIPGRKRWFLFGKKKTRLIAICLDCWSEMDFVGTV